MTGAPHEPVAEALDLRLRIGAVLKVAVHVAAARALLDGGEHVPAQSKRARCDGSGLGEREAAAAHSDGGSDGSSNGGGGSSNGGGGLGSGGEGGAGQGGEVAAGSEATGRATPDRVRQHGASSDIHARRTAIAGGTDAM